jgi:hypothetical protein
MEKHFGQIRLVLSLSVRSQNNLMMLVIARFSFPMAPSSKIQSAYIDQKFENLRIEELSSMPPNTGRDHCFNWFQTCVIIVLGIENMVQGSTGSGRRTFYTIPDVATLKLNRLDSSYFAA